MDRTLWKTEDFPPSLGCTLPEAANTQNRVVFADIAANGKSFARLYIALENHEPAQYTATLFTGALYSDAYKTPQGIKSAIITRKGGALIFGEKYTDQMPPFVPVNFSNPSERTIPPATLFLYRCDNNGYTNLCGLTQNDTTFPGYHTITVGKVLNPEIIGTLFVAMSDHGLSDLEYSIIESGEM